MNHNMLKRATRQIKGLIIRWIDPDPLTHQSDPIPSEVTHRSPVMRCFAKQIFTDYLTWITHDHPFRWLIKITVVFRYPNGIEQREEVELEACTIMAKLNDLAMAQIASAMRAGDQGSYLHTEFEIECLGS